MNQIPAEMNTESTSNSNYVNSLTELKLMIATLEAKNETLQGKVENLELKAENRALKENAEQKAKYQALEAKVNEFPKVLAEQQKEMMAQFQAQNKSLEQKLKEAEQRAQMEKNELEKIIQQKMEKFRAEMDENGQQEIDSNLSKLEFMWDQLMMSKSKILANPKGAVWDGSKTEASISQCGLKLKGTDFQWVFATKGCAISGEHCRKENFQFPGTVVYYYEVTTSRLYWSFSVGFTDGSKPPSHVGDSPNAYGIDGFVTENYSIWHSGKKHKLVCPTRLIAGDNIIGFGLLMNSRNELAVFFTVNGFLLGKQTPITPTVDRLYPTVPIYHASMEANFGGNIVAKPFKYDISKCPGLVFE